MSEKGFTGRVTGAQVVMVPEVAGWRERSGGRFLARNLSLSGQRTFVTRVLMIRLDCLEGPLEGTTFVFEQDAITIGRSPVCDLVVDDAMCSRRHAELRMQRGTCVFSDLQSTNGVELNGVRVVNAEINYGDRLRVGDSVFVFQPRVVVDEEELPELESHTVIERTQPLGAFDRRLEKLGANPFGEAVEASSAHLEEVSRVNRQLSTVYNMSRTISRAILPQDLYERVCDTIFENFPEADRVCIFLKDKSSGVLTAANSRCRDGTGDAPVSRDILRQVEEQQVGIMASDASSDDRFDSDTLISMHVRSLLCTPLTARGHFLGALYVENCTKVSCFDESELELLTVLGNQVAIAVENALLYEEVQVSFYETVRSLGNALEAKDRYTRGHSARVARYAVGIAEEMKLPTDQVERIRIGAELHDIGKIAIDESIINTRNRLTDEQFEIIKQHPDLGVKILKPIHFLEPILPMIRHHHERYDGRGYPDKLSGNDIPLEARILNLADAFDAMTTQRPYNKPRTIENAVAHCTQEGGVSFDMDCVQALLRHVENTRRKTGLPQTQIIEREPVEA